MTLTQASTSLRSELYRALLDPKQAGQGLMRFEGFVALLIVLNLLALWLEHIPAVYQPYKDYFDGFDKLSVAIFTVEFLLRLYLAPEDASLASKRWPRARHLASPYTVIDILAIAPFYLTFIFSLDLRLLRVLRLLRILKLARWILPAMQEFVQHVEGMTLRRKLYLLLWHGESELRLQRQVNAFLVSTIAISFVAILLESIQEIRSLIEVELAVIESLIVAIFTAEYLLRLYVCVEDIRYREGLGRLRYASSGMALVDLAAIAPFFLGLVFASAIDTRFLRLLRLLQLLKLTRYSGATFTLGKVLRREWPVIAAAGLVMLLLIVLTASLGFLFEHEAQPDKFENIPTAIYWAVITLASVGYGDLAPVTPMGRMLTVVLAFIGIGIFAIPAALLSSAFTDELHKDREIMRRDLQRALLLGPLEPQTLRELHEEARRLHIPLVEFNEMVESLSAEVQMQSHGGASEALLQQQPRYALQRFRELVVQLQTIESVANPNELGRLIDDPTETSGIERAVWRTIRRAGTP